LQSHSVCIFSYTSIQLDNETNLLYYLIFFFTTNTTIETNNITTSNSAITAVAATVNHTGVGTEVPGAEGFKVGVRRATRASAAAESEVC
jgi:hypothetical protein